MSQPSQSLGYVCRACRHALRASRSSVASQSARSFSSTSHNAKVLATFTPTSSPELDALLSSWRTTVFLPSVLPPHNQALLYKTSRHDILTSPPGVTVTVQTRRHDSSGEGEEQIKLQPMNAFDKPNTAKSLSQLVNLLTDCEKDAEAWNNVIPLLEGLAYARVNLPSGFLEKLTRRSFEASPSRHGTIIRCAEMADRTRVHLSERAVTRELIIGLHRAAVAGKYQSSSHAKTLRKLVLMLEKEEHCNNSDLVKQGQKGHVDMRQDPLLLAALLEHSAAAALRDPTNSQGPIDVISTAQKFLVLSTELEASGKDIFSTIPQNYVSTPHSTRFVLEDLVLIHHALAIAHKVNTKGQINLKVSVQKLAKRCEEKMAELNNAVGQSEGKTAENTTKSRASLMRQEAERVRDQLKA